METTLTFYVKDESGNFNEATDSDYEKAFEERSARIVSKKLAKSVANKLEQGRPEFERKVREEEEDKIRKELETEYLPKIDEANKRADELDVKLRRKTIAAEYGFKQEAEEFLGDGDEDSMRAKADTLKHSFSSPEVSFPDKESGEVKSDVETKYGLDVKI